jgi:hypothetical protein
MVGDWCQSDFCGADSRYLSSGMRFTSFTTSKPPSSDAIDAVFRVTADAQ